MIYFRQGFIDFFEELSENNHKDWFDANKKRYESEVKEPFLALVNDIIPLYRKFEPNFKEDAKKTIFRINRDVRFSKNKSPYKTHVAAFMGVEGKKSEFPGFYLHLDAKECWFGGGCFELSKDNLFSLRMEIAYRQEEWQQALENQKFKNTFSGLAKSEVNKKMPDELKTFENLPTEILNKQFYYTSTQASNLILTDQLLPEIWNAIEASESVYRFLCRIFV